MKPHPATISDSEQAKIMTDGFKSMQGFLRLHGVPAGADLPAEEYDRLFQKMGIDLSGAEYKKLAANLLAANKEAVNEAERAD